MFDLMISGITVINKNRWFTCRPTCFVLKCMVLIDREEISQRTLATQARHNFGIASIIFVPNNLETLFSKQTDPTKSTEELLRRSKYKIAALLLRLNKEIFIVYGL